METLIRKIIRNDILHAKWLNTLSYLENCGARKIAACEHSTKVREEMLKHAAEEFRHAHYLKRQIGKLTEEVSPDYTLSTLLGGISSLRYLDVLDLFTVRYLRQVTKWNRVEVRGAAYLLVTYAIELRAEKLYPIYHTALKEMGSKVRVKSIILEEKEHLEEMRCELTKLPSGWLYAKKVCRVEERCYQKWVVALRSQVPR